jgi:hypothetical protein
VTEQTTNHLKIFIPVKYPLRLGLPDISDISKVGKPYKCSNCGREKIIHREEFSENSDVHRHYCEECTTLLNKKTKCKFCEEEIRRNELPQHLSDYHSN